MSLKVWLPLDGSLENKGISNITAINSNATIDSSGKIGSCYSFDGSNDYIYLNNFNPDGWPEMSVAFWFYSDGTANNFFLLRAEQKHKFRINGTGIGFRDTQNSSTQRTINWSTNLPINAWTHVVCIYNRGTILLYKNGILDTYNSTYYHKNGVMDTSSLNSIRIGRIESSSSNTYYKGKINDFRIYNHCLSAAEVKEIAMGLVLHYKLDSRGPSLGNPNLLINSTVPTAGNGASGIVKSITEDGLQKVVADTSNGNWVTFSNHNTTLTLSKGDTFTFSLKIKSDDSVKKPTVYLQSGMGYFSMQGTMSPNWSIIYYTGTWNIDNLQTNIHLGFGSAPGTYYIEYFKLEKGDSYTLWAPAAGEYLSDLNYIEDSSGYNHNGSILNNVLISSDTPRYSTSINLVAGNSAINCGRGGMVTDSITVNLWIKASTWANPVSCTEGGGWNFEASGDYFRFPIYISGVGYKYGISATKRTELCDNQWHMLTGMYDRINGHIKIYVDGELDNDYNADTTNAIGYHGSNVIWLGAEASGSSTAIGSNGMIGLFSDFRIYCTALSADDILALYHTGAKIDNLQNLHTFEGIENQPSIKLTKQGQLKCDEVVESTTTKFKKNKTIETNNLIEL